MATGQRCGSQKDPLATLAGQKEITWQRWFTKGSIGNAGWTERDHLATLWFTKGSIGNAGWTERDHLATLVHKRIHWQRWLDRKRSLGNAGSQKDPLATLACKRVGNIAGSRKSANRECVQSLAPPQRPQQRTSANPECVWSLAPASTAATSTHSPRARGQRRRLFHHVYTWAAVKKRKSGLKRNGAYKLCSS
ncbi:hypothetical protein ACLKA6_002438 [Drosophila palustris]